MADLPKIITDWFATRGWAPHPHQIEMFARAEDPATLLIAAAEDTRVITEG